MIRAVLGAKKGLLCSRSSYSGFSSRHAVRCALTWPRILRFQKRDDLPALLLGQLRPAGHSLLRSPLVMNQNSSPGLALLTFEVVKASAPGPCPARLLPWHCAQFCAYSFLPPAAACRVAGVRVLHLRGRGGCIAKTEV